MANQPPPVTPEPSPAPDDSAPSSAAPSDGGAAPSVETDEPPIIISGGSLFFEFPNRRNVVQFDHVPNHPRPFKYNYAEGHPERDLESVRVVTQLNNGKVSFTQEPPPVFPENQKCILQIWLQPLTLNGVNVVPGNMETEPDVQIRGAEQVGPAGTPTTILIETKRQLLAEVHSHKQSRRHRNDYPPISSHFRIGRWRVVNGLTGQQLAGASGDDAYQLFVTFHTH